jgi:hypothetical protein
MESRLISPILSIGALISSIPDVSIASDTGLLTTTSGPTTVQFVVVAIDPTTGLSAQLNFTVHP